MQVRLYLVRFPNCHECQLGFQYPKKWEIGKQWLVAEKNYIAVVTKLGKFTSYVSQDVSEKRFSNVHGFLAGRPNVSSRQSSFQLEAIENEMRIARRTK